MKFLSWKGISIYLTIVLFLFILIQLLDWDKGGEKEGQYAVELEKAYFDLVDFQTYLLNGEVAIDENKHVLTMYSKNFQYQLSMFIDIFGNKEQDDTSLFDVYAQVDEALDAFYEAENSKQQYDAHLQLVEAKRPLMTIMNDLK